MSDKILKNNFQNRILNLIKKQLKKIIILFVFIIFLFFSYLSYINLKKKNELRISENYTQATVQFKKEKMSESKLLLESIIEKRHKFYSPLALYFIIDNNLEEIGRAHV